LDDGHSHAAAGVGGQLDSNGADNNAASTPGACGSAEDGAVYLASVKTAQQELNAAGAAVCSGAQLPAAGTTARWPGPSTGYSQLASMTAATQAALAAAGLSTPLEGCSLNSQANSIRQAEDAAAVRPTSAEGDQLLQSGTAGSNTQSKVTTAPESFDLDLVNSWSSAATDPAPDGDGVDAAAAAMDRPLACDASTTCRVPSSSSVVSDKQLDDGGADVADGGHACLEDVVVAVGDAGTQPQEVPEGSFSALGLYDLD